MKRNLILLLAVLMLVVAPAMLLRAEAATIVDSGTCGENLTWTLDSEGTLTISGTGDMEYYDYYEDYAPWYSQRESILSVVVEEGVNGIGSSAFWDCSRLTSVTIPDSVTSIGSAAFSGCSALESMTIPFVGRSVKRATDTYQYPFGYIFGTSSYTGGTATWQNYYGSSTSSTTYDTYYIPSGLKSVTVTGGNILCEAFGGCRNLTSITLPEGITTIGYSAFRNCDSLSSITIPDGVTSIGEKAFYYCSSLSSITIPDSVTSIGNYAFYDCDSLSSVVIGNGVTTIGYETFYDCDSLTSITIPDSVTSIGLCAFYDCDSLSSVVIGNGVTSIGWCAFYDCHSLAVVHYGGTEAQRADILIGTSNEDLINATWLYVCSGILFGDVAEDAYYFDPVLWAVDNGITNGLSADTFGPEATCTRGQIVTFLWRACGSPEPNMAFNPFSDVSSEDYFYDAVLWAVENGITGGMGDGTFAPGAPCTRGQVATFLWRAEGQPYSYGENIFSDISYGAYYYDAVLWAVENGITNGMGEGIFAPDSSCTRGQIVTFLYRAMN